MATLLNGWILPIGGVASGRVGAWSLRSRLVNDYIISKINIGSLSNNIFLRPFHGNLKVIHVVTIEVEHPPDDQAAGLAPPI